MSVDFLWKIRNCMKEEQFLALSILIGIIGKCESMKWESERKSLTPCLTRFRLTPSKHGMPWHSQPCISGCTALPGDQSLKSSDDTAILPSYHPTILPCTCITFTINIYHNHYHDKAQKNTQWSNILRASSHIRQHPQQLLREHVAVPVATSRHSTLAQHIMKNSKTHWKIVCQKDLPVATVGTPLLLC